MWGELVQLFYTPQHKTVATPDFFFFFKKTAQVIFKRFAAKVAQLLDFVTLLSITVKVKGGGWAVSASNEDCRDLSSAGQTGNWSTC